MSAITTHVLDIARGRPAAGVEVRLDVHTADGDWETLAAGSTDADGRVRDLLPEEAALAPGTYRLRFATGAYFARQEIPAFWPEVTVVFAVREPGGRYHVPLLLSPYGYSTYRGS